MDKVMEIPLANVARVEIVTQEETARTFVVRTGSEVTLEAFVSEGEEKELRKGNRLIAQLRTEDIVKGYDIKLKDLVMTPEVFALVDGGASSEAGGMAQYTGPTMGEVVERVPFTLTVYTEEKDGDGETVSYMKLSCAHCKGTPATIAIRDGEFCAPEYVIKSRPARGASPLTMEQVASLPA